jgi:hypothetical protein
LEKRVCQAIQAATGREAWEVFDRADQLFAAIAADGDLRFSRSQE